MSNSQVSIFGPYKSMAATSMKESNSIQFPTCTSDHAKLMILMPPLNHDVDKDDYEE